MALSAPQAKYFACWLTRSLPPDSLGKFTASLQGAQVDLTPHQIDAKLFASRFQDMPIWTPLASNLSWFHFLQVIPIEDTLKRDFYLTIAADQRWSKRTLQAKIDGMLYERTAIAKQPEEVIVHDLEELRLLIEPQKHRFGEVETGTLPNGKLWKVNMFIHGDNLLALKALEQDFAGQIKCIFIDSPYNILATVRRFSFYETIGGLFREVTRNSVELTITERIWGMIIDIVNEIAQCFEIEDEKIFQTLINRSDKLKHFIQIYELKMAS